MLPQPTIGFYCSSVNWSGLEMSLVKRARWWKERGQQAVVFCVDESPVYKKSKEELLRIERVFRNKRTGDRPNARRVYGLCEKHQINVLWIRDSRDIAIAGQVKRFSGNRMVLLYQQATHFGARMKGWMQTRRLNRIDIWVTPLEFLGRQVMGRTNFPSERIHVIPTGVDIQQLLFQTVEKSAGRMRYNLDANATLIGIIGRIDPSKGQLFLVSAFAELRKNHPELHLLIVGERKEEENNSYEEDVKKLIAKLGMKSVIHIRPFSEDVGSFYAAADIVVVATKAETFAMVTLEAMLFGCRIIGTNSGGSAELLGGGDFGELYTPDNIREFCQAFETVMVDEDRSIEKARNARIFARERFTHHQECEEIQYLLEKHLTEIAKKSS